MKFYSTKRNAPAVSFKEAVIKSLPEDKGLYFPEEIPELDFLFLETLDYYSFSDIGIEIMRHFCKEDIPEAKLQEIMQEVLSFDVPLKNIHDQIHSMELFHGPTYAFKDVGARFLARCLGYFNETENKEVTILVATSGDTGGAVASGFYEVPGVEVVILYPSGKVSELQEKQLTTLGKNITALEVDGNFDDCQALVKQAFLDQDITSKKNLSSANSINIARWLPQSIYYFEAYKQLKKKKEVVFAVPSGNYGNITAGMVAQKMGLPIKRFIAASNANDVVPRYLKTGAYEPHPTIQTIANAMDVNDPSNHPRMLELFEQDFQAIQQLISGFTLQDDQIREVIRQCKADHDYLLDPHGAIGYAALEQSLGKKETGIFLETAHPCKFQPVMEEALGEQVAIPEFAKDLMTKEKVAQSMKADYEDFKAFLMN